MSLDSCEAGFIIDSLLGGVSSKWVHFIFGLEASDVQVESINLFRYFFLSDQACGRICILFLLVPGSLYIVEWNQQY